MIQPTPFCHTPREALELRRKALNFWTNPSDLALQWINQIPVLDDDVDPAATRQMMIARHRWLLQNSPLYLVSDEMTEVARTAAVTLPTFVLEREDFPSDSGLLIFHHPAATYAGRESHDYVAGAWWLGPVSDGSFSACFLWFEDREAGSIDMSQWDDMNLTEAERREGAAWVRLQNREHFPRLMYDTWAQVHIGDDFSAVIPKAPLLPHLLSALLLMQQPLAAKERVAAAPSDRRRAKRAGISERDITVVKLRHIKHAGAAGVTRPVQWRHRWIVRGHWRNQWLPSRGVHRPTWISPHVKGPDSLPVKVTEKINVWAR